LTAAPAPSILARVDAQFDSAKKLVQDLIRKLGLDPKTACIKDEADQASYTLKRGSASILVTVLSRQEGDKATYLRVASPVVTLPQEAGKHLTIFKRLLELNANGLVNSAFGLVGDRVVVVSERPTEGLDAEEVDQIVRHLAAVADTYDDRLAKEFGAKK
jgi:hypothetical protein